MTRYPCIHTDSASFCVQLIFENDFEVAYFMFVESVFGADEKKSSLYYFTFILRSNIRTLIVIKDKYAILSTHKHNVKKKKENKKLRK